MREPLVSRRDALVSVGAARGDPHRRGYRRRRRSSRLGSVDHQDEHRGGADAVPRRAGSAGTEWLVHRIEEFTDGPEDQDRRRHDVERLGRDQVDPRARALRPPIRRAAGAGLRLQGLARETQPYDDVRVRKAVNSRSTGRRPSTRSTAATASTRALPPGYGPWPLAQVELMLNDGRVLRRLQQGLRNTVSLSP